MTHESPDTETAFGYLSVVHSLEHGYFGGYLIVSALGRPLEFHCTAPVLPSRAQQILYGATLQPYLMGDQIGGTLLGAAKLIPQLILTNQGATVGLRSRSRVPLALVLECDDSTENSVGDLHSAADKNVASSQPSSAAVEGCPSWGHPFFVGSHRLQLPLGYESDRNAVVTFLTVLSERVELVEPFDRIHEAICEAQRIGGRGADTHASAA